MLKNNVTPSQHQNIDWDKLCGPVSIPLTNDYLFRALLQRNNSVLKALICSLLHLKNSDVSSVMITNPIELGKAITDKEFILDIRIELNRNMVIDLEMQVLDEGNWPERSLCYLCRTFDNLNRGEDYSAVKPAVHIGILDFVLFEEAPEFYATYWMMNEKTHRIYSDKLRLSVLDLNHINLATEEDRHYKIDHWASLFRSTTWEELKMLAKSDKYIQEAADSIYELTQDEKIRQQCEAREDYRRRTAGRERMLKEALEKNQQLTEEKQKLSEEKQQLSEEKQQLSEEKQQLSEEKQQLSKEKRQLSEENQRLYQLLLANGIDVEQK